MDANPAIAAGAQFAAAYATLNAAHDAGDYFIQRDADAVRKGRPGAEGVAACSRHIASYAATQALALYAANRYLGLRLNPRRAAAGLTLSAATHYIVDRCYGHWADTGPDAPLLVRALHASGKKEWLTRDPTAGPLVDQAWHRVWITVSAVLVAGAGRAR